MRTCTHYLVDTFSDGSFYRAGLPLGDYTVGFANLSPAEAALSSDEVAVKLAADGSSGTVAKVVLTVRNP